MAVQSGLCQNWSETAKTGFLTTRLISFQVSKMAAKVGGSDLEKKCCEFAKLAGSKDDHQLTSKGAGKLAKDCWAGKYKNVCTYVDASVFPKCKEQGKP